MKFFKSLDFFTKAKEEVDTSTSIGGLFTVLGFICGVLFLILEFSSFMKYSNVTTMNVRNEPLGKEEKINIDISFLKMPCQLITMNKDEEGGPSTPEHKVVRERLDSQGKTISLYVPAHNKDNDEIFEQTVNAISNGEGCRFHGNITVKEVPGNLKFELRDRLDLYRRLSADQVKNATLDFVLNHLTFGPDYFHPVIFKRYPKENLKPYDGLEMKDLRFNEKVSMYTKAVLNTYDTKGSKKGSPAFQFSARYQKKEVTSMSQYLNHYNRGNIEIPSFLIHYEFSPIHIRHKRVSNSFSRFLVDTLAIVGGIFSVMGMLSNLTLTRFKELRRL